MGDRTLDSPKFKSDVLQIRAIDAEFDARFGPGNWDLIDVEGNAGKGTWADYGVTGRTMRRAGPDAAIDAVMSTPTNAIGVLNVSRWARNLTAALQRIDELKKLGVYRYSADECVDLLSPEGRFVTGLYLQIAELFSGQKSVAWSRLIELNAEQGKHHGNPPAGYRRSGLREVDGRQFATGDIQPDPAQRDAIVAAFTSYADGASKMKVGRELVNRGVVSSASQARSVLENRAYRRFHGTACGRHRRTSERRGRSGTTDDVDRDCCVAGYEVATVFCVDASRTIGDLPLTLCAIRSARQMENPPLSCSAEPHPEIRAARNAERRTLPASSRSASSTISNDLGNL